MFDFARNAQPMVGLRRSRIVEKRFRDWLEDFLPIAPGRADGQVYWRIVRRRRCHCTIRDRKPRSGAAGVIDDRDGGMPRTGVQPIFAICIRPLAQGWPVDHVKALSW